MARIGLLGGSFNPPHVGHQMLALWALSTARVDQVWLVPCFSHAFGKALEPFDDRFEMCRLALADLEQSRVFVSDIERSIGGTSRTLVTVLALAERYPEHDWALLIGADLLAEIGSWYGAKQLEQLVELVVAGRPGFSEAAEGAGYTAGDLVELVALSSSDVRERLASGADVSHLVPARVERYIRAKGLYGNLAAGDLGGGPSPSGDDDAPK
jgi:nicotinate-nucleotide adenylyltransferase